MKSFNIWKEAKGARELQATTKKANININKVYNNKNKKVNNRS